MARRRDGDAGRFLDYRRVEKAAAEGVYEALRRHVQAGVPASEWVDGRVVHVSPRRLAARLRAMKRGKA